MALRLVSWKTPSFLLSYKKNCRCAIQTYRFLSWENSVQFEREEKTTKQKSNAPNSINSRTVKRNYAWETKPNARQIEKLKQQHHQNKIDGLKHERRGAVRWNLPMSSFFGSNNRLFDILIWKYSTHWGLSNTVLVLLTYYWICHSTTTIQWKLQTLCKPNIEKIRFEYGV